MDACKPLRIEPAYRDLSWVWSLVEANAPYRSMAGLDGYREYSGLSSIPWFREHWALDGRALDGPVPPRHALTGETVLALVHTSGTTGRAKAIPLRHGALMMSVADFAIEIGDQVAGSRHLQILPLFHLGGFGQCMQAILTAARRHVPAGAGRARDPDRGVPGLQETLVDQGRPRGAVP